MTPENQLNLRALVPHAGGKPPSVEQIIVSYKLVTAVACEAIPAHQPLPKPTLFPEGQK